jgi:hypothetical protein
MVPVVSSLLKQCGYEDTATSLEHEAKRKGDVGVQGEVRAICSGHRLLRPFGIRATIPLCVCWRRRLTASSAWCTPSIRPSARHPPAPATPKHSLLLPSVPVWTHLALRLAPPRRPTTMLTLTPTPIPTPPVKTPRTMSAPTPPLPPRLQL